GPSTWTELNVLLGSSGVARISRAAAARFAGVGSAPSPRAKPNVAKQKNSNRQADINGNLAKVNACLAEAAGYARRGRLPCTKATNPQPILFAAEIKADSAFPQFLQLRDECGRTVGKIAVVPPKLLSVGAKDNNGGKPYNLVLQRKF